MLLLLRAHGGFVLLAKLGLRGVVRLLLLARIGFVRLFLSVELLVVLLPGRRHQRFVHMVLLAKLLFVGVIARLRSGVLHALNVGGRHIGLGAGVGLALLAVGDDLLFLQADLGHIELVLAILRVGCGVGSAELDVVLGLCGLGLRIDEVGLGLHLRGLRLGVGRRRGGVLVEELRRVGKADAANAGGADLHHVERQRIVLGHLIERGVAQHALQMRGGVRIGAGDDQGLIDRLQELLFVPIHPRGLLRVHFLLVLGFLLAAPPALRAF